MARRRVATRGDPGRPVVNRFSRRKTTLPAGLPFCSHDGAVPVPGTADMDKEQGMTNAATPYLNTRQAADHLGLSTRTLDRFRVSGDGPVFLKFGGRVRYLREDLDAWARTRRRKSTSDDGTALAGATP